MSMQRIVPTTTGISFPFWKPTTAQPRPCDVFINHRGPDTKRTVAGLLFDRLVNLKLRPFLDKNSMEPGDKLFPGLKAAIENCKVGVAIFSPRYSESRFCLEELALLVEARKKLIPIFCDIQPSDLLKMNNSRATPEEMERYRRALHEARFTIGIVFDSENGNWADLVREASDMVLKSLKDERGSINCLTLRQFCLRNE